MVGTIQQDTAHIYIHSHPRPIKGHMFNCFCKYQTITWQRFSAIGRAEMVKTTSWSSTEENEQRLVDVRDQKKNGHTASGYNSINHLLQPWYAEEHLSESTCQSL